MKRIQCKKTMGIALLAIVAWASACDDDDNHKNDLIQQDRDFIAQASYVNRSEVELGTLAVSKGNSDAVRMYGSSMRTEHQPALDKLKGITSDLGADFPTGLDAENQAIKDKLMSLSGYAFDTAYIHSQIKGHQKAEALFQAEANNGKELRLKDYANDLLPHIRIHLQMADSIAATLVTPAQGRATNN